jgi:prophage regulatory protein
MTAPVRLLTVGEISAMTTLADSTLYVWASKGRGPRSFKLGGRRVYREDEVLAWIAEQEQATSRGGES